MKCSEKFFREHYAKCIQTRDFVTCFDWVHADPFVLPHIGKFLMKIIMHQRAVKMRLNTMILWRNFHLITQRWQRYWQNNLVHIDFNSGIQASICYTTVLMWLWLAHALTLGISHVKSPFVQLLKFKMKFWSKLSI